MLSVIFIPCFSLNTVAILYCLDAFLIASSLLFHCTSGHPEVLLPLIHGVLLSHTAYVIQKWFVSNSDIF